MLTAEEVFQAIQSLPVHERLRIIERVIHELANAAALEAEARSTKLQPVVLSSPRQTAREPATPRPKLSPIGWLADEPQLADALVKSVTEGRKA